MHLLQCQSTSVHFHIVTFHTYRHRCHHRCPRPLGCMKDYSGGACGRCCDQRRARGSVRFAYISSHMPTTAAISPWQSFRQMK